MNHAQATGRAKETELRRRDPRISSVDTMVNVVNHAHKRAKMKEQLRYNRMIVRKIRTAVNRIVDAATVFFSLIGLGYSIYFVIDVVLR